MVRVIARLDSSLAQSPQTSWQCPSEGIISGAEKTQERGVVEMDSWRSGAEESAFQPVSMWRDARPCDQTVLDVLDPGHPYQRRSQNSTACKIRLPRCSCLAPALQVLPRMAGREALLLGTQDPPPPKIRASKASAHFCPRPVDQDCSLSL